MNDLEAIRERLTAYYQTSPRIRIRLSLKHPKLSLPEATVTLTGIYPHVFRLEETRLGTPRTHTHPYSDVLTGQIEILGPADTP